MPEVEAITAPTTSLPNITGGGSSLGQSRVFPADGEGNDVLEAKNAEHSDLRPARVLATENMLPSLLPFAHQVLDTEDEINARERLPGYKKNMIKVDRSTIQKGAIRNNEISKAGTEDGHDGVQDGDEGMSPRTLRRQRYLINTKNRQVQVKQAQKNRHAKRIRKRPRVIPPMRQVGNPDVMINVLDDDQDPIIPDLSSVFIGEGETADAAAATSSAMFGPGLSITNGDRSVDVGNITANSTKLQQLPW